MKKLAVFVEGQTEQVFLREYIEQIAGLGNIKFTCESRSNIVRLTEAPGSGHERAQVLLYDCQNDGAVKSSMLDQRASLAKAGYAQILGLRDLYPSALVDLPGVKAKLAVGIPIGGIPIRVFLAVAEVEAWFMQEANHFSNIHVDLNVTDFKKKFGFDPLSESAESLIQPAATLHKIYSSVGLAYRKKFRHVRRTVRAIDFENLYINCFGLLPHLAEFSEEIENFLAPDLM